MKRTQVELVPPTHPPTHPPAPPPAAQLLAYRDGQEVWVVGEPHAALGTHG